MLRLIAAFASAFALLSSATVLAQSPAAAETPAAAAAQPNDYSKPATWLCRPDTKDSCAVDLSTTIVAPSGKFKKESFKAARNASIDCFYVYPTVSLDQTGNSDMTAGPEEHGVILQQFARFSSVCRVYAPLYRQVTLTALRSIISGKAIPVDRMLAYNDVLDAWNYYLKNDNAGRGVVLVGHSQGSGVLTQLIRNEIDGKPVQQKMISALLLGTNLPVEKGKDVGAFQNIPLCKSASQIGCAVAYASFRDNVPPPANSRFGTAQGENMAAACVNPAALGGGSGQLHAYLSNGRFIASSAAAPKPWVTPEHKVTTPFVSVPGLLTAECVSNEGGTYLAVHVNAGPNDPRTDDIVGDVVVNNQVQQDWGLHLIDANLAMGNLVELVREQTKAYSKK
ncbi:MAG: DUF3089 domain-containing protein [Steroidobacteraceae bacterium]